MSRLQPPPVVELREGGTGARTREQAAENLKVPTLGGDNIFLGNQTFDGDLTVEDGGTTTILGALELQGSLTHSGDDPVEFESGLHVAGDLTKDGDAVLVDAPSDGKYYVRKDGAWVEIVP